MKVLIAEDNKSTSSVLSKMFSSYGDCNIAKDGVETVDLFLKAIEDKSYYDLICLDIMMPKINGIRALNIIRNIEKEKHRLNKLNTNIIMLSVLNDNETVQRCKAEGCNYFLSKPIFKNQIDEVMNKLGYLKKGEN
jgi:two-component system chemotaxis response regulator CheY